MHLNRILAALLAAIAGLTYVRTLLPGIGNSGDTAKFAFAGYVWGTAHANGYPTYLILNHFFTTFLPFGSIAYRANLLSAVFSVIALIVLYRIFILLKVKPIIAFLVCLAFSCTRTLWSQSVVAEMYTLHVLFVSLVMFFFLKWNATHKERDLLLGCGFYAFSFGNSPSMIALLPAIIFLTLKTKKQIFFNRNLVLKIGALIVFGILQYSYSLWRYYDPHTKYLEIATPDLKTLWWAMTGAQLRSTLFSIPISFIVQQRIPEVAILFLKEFFYWIPLAIFGIKRLNRTLNVFFLLAFVGNMFLVFNFYFRVWTIYFLPNYFIIAIYLGLALDWFYERLSRKSLQYATLAVSLCIPMTLFFSNYSVVDQHKNTLIADTAKKYLALVDSNALIVSPGYDASEYLWYYLIGEGLQDKTQNYVIHDCSIDQIKAYIEENRPIYSSIQRIHIPAGLQVYCLGPSYVEGLQKAGLKVQLLKMGLFRVSKG